MVCQSRRDSVRSRASLENLMAVLLQDRAQGLSCVGVVFDDQNSPPHIRRGGGHGQIRRLFHRRFDSRHPNRKSAATTESAAMHLGRSSMQSHQPSDERQPDAETATRAVGSLIALDEKIEYACQQVAGDSIAVVFGTDDRAVAFGSYAEDNFAVRACVVERVG